MDEQKKRLIEEQIQYQRAYFLEGNTRLLNDRIRNLRLLQKQLERYEEQLIEACISDLKQTKEIIYMMQIQVIYAELKNCIKGVKRWCSEKNIRTRNFFGKQEASIYQKPYGLVFILSNWSNALSNTLIPMINAIASGNCVIVRLSSRATKISQVLKKLLSELYFNRLVYVAEGDHSIVSQIILQQPDFIHFVGKVTVGREIIKQAANYLIPTSTLLGAKSPCVVTPSADLKLAAKQIIWGKWIACGQTGYAPDFILVHEKVKLTFIECLIECIRKQFGIDPTHNPNYPAICHKKEFDRLTELISAGRILWGGRSNEKTLQIEPTIVDQVSWSSPLMRQEIYGPIFPIIDYSSFDKIIYNLNVMPQPLCFYLFSQNETEINFVKEVGVYGSCCINDVMIQGLSSHFPISGHGWSGTGTLHGEYGIKNFSYPVSVVSVSEQEKHPSRFGKEIS